MRGCENIQRRGVDWFGETGSPVEEVMALSHGPGKFCFFSVYSQTLGFQSSFSYYLPPTHKSVQHCAWHIGKLSKLFAKLIYKIQDSGHCFSFFPLFSPTPT